MRNLSKILLNVTKIHIPHRGSKQCFSSCSDPGSEYDELEFNTRKLISLLGAESDDGGGDMEFSTQRLVENEIEWQCCTCCAIHRGRGNSTRTVCPVCMTKRHNAHTSTWKQHQNNWSCCHCGELNFSDGSLSETLRNRCRCCNKSRETRRCETRSQSGVRHEQLPIAFTDPRKNTKDGEVYRAQDMLARWRCVKCSRMSKQFTWTCDSCSVDRFESIPVACPSCKSQLSQTARDVVYRKPCAGCGSPLHGAQMKSTLSGWMCTCGTANSGLTCSRCRAPMRLHSVALMGDSGNNNFDAAWEWMRLFDFDYCTNWTCANCFTTNEAAKKIKVGAGLHGRPQIQSVLGQVRCSKCNELWHSTKVNRGRDWRCACHQINDTHSKLCSSCLRPQTLAQNFAHSFWTVGDWICARCQKHNFRDRNTCAACRHPNNS